MPSRPLQDVLTCLRHKKTLENVGQLLCRNSQLYLKSSEEMLQLFADVPEATANTVELADRLGFTLQNLGYEFPTFPTPLPDESISDKEQRSKGQPDGSRRAIAPQTLRDRRRLP